MRIRLTLAVVACWASLCIAQDTLTVQTFQWEDDFRSEVFDFPDEDGQTYEKIWMLYNMRCHDNAVGSGNVGCREWDYSCNTFLIDSSRVDSLQRTHPNYIISNFDGSNFEYSSQPTYSYYRYEQRNTRYLSTEVERLAGVGTGNEKLNLFDSPGAGKSRFLYTADELGAAGLVAGNITGLWLNVSELGGEARFLRLRLKATDKSVLDPANPEMGEFTEVYFKNTNFNSRGEFAFNFHEEFDWNGTDNLILEVSYSASPSAANNVFRGHDAGMGRAIKAQPDAHQEFSGSHAIEVPPAAFDNISDEITLTFWNRGNAETLPANSTILEGRTAAGQRTINIHLPWGNSNVYWDCGNEGGSYDRINQLAEEADLEGQWNHWAFTKNNTTGEMKIYLNGDLWLSGANRTRTIDVQQFRLGGSGNGSLGHYGSVDEFCVFSKELDQNSIRDWMFRSIDNTHPNYDQLELYYPMNDGSGTSVGDASGKQQDGQLDFAAGWRSERGRNLFKSFVAAPHRLNATFVQGVYQKETDVIEVLDSVVNDPHRVIQYAVEGTDLVVVDTSFYWQAGFLPVYDESGEIVDDILVEGEDALDIDQMVYFDKFPAKFELLSLVTPYGNGLSLGEDGKTFTFDVTDYAPLLKGRKRLSIELGGQFQEELDIRFVYIKGTPARQVLNVQNIWPFRRGWYEAIQQDRVFEARTVPLADNGKHFKLRSTVTGHGQNGEFVPREHYLNLDGGSQDFTYRVWKECGLNPIYPQGGTWTFDRAGWCPGMATDVHDFDITDRVTPGGTVRIDYGVNGATLTEANYLVSTQLFTYGDIERSLDAAIGAIVRPSNQVEYERINPACDNPLILLENMGTTPLTSAKITYGLQGSESQEYEWTGNLAFGQTEQVALPLLDPQMWESMDEQPLFEVQISQINGGADENSRNNRMESRFRKADVFDYDRLQLHLRTNRRPLENSYSIKNHRGETLLSRTNMTSNTEYIDELDFPPGCYTLEFRDSEDDGLYYWYWDAIGQSRGRGSLAIKEWRSENIQRTRKTFEPEFGRSIRYDFVIPGLINSTKVERPRLLSVYPNPTDAEFVVELAGFDGQEFEISLLDVMGRRLQEVSISQFPEEGLRQTFQIGDLPEGVYFVRIANGERVWTRQIVKQK